MSDEKNKIDSRWWESYLVRYLSGTVIGAICIQILILYIVQRTGVLGISAESIRIDAIKELPLVAFLVTLLVLGLAFSYLVSAPITVFHYGRMKTWLPDSYPRYLWISWVIFLFKGSGVFTSYSLVAYTPGTIHYSIAASFFVLDAIFLSHLYKKKNKKSIAVVLPFKCDFAVSFFDNAKQLLEKRLPKLQDFMNNLEANESRLIEYFVRFVRSLLRLFVAYAMLSYLFKVLATELGATTKLTEHLLLFSLPVFWIVILQTLSITKIIAYEKDIHEAYRQLTSARIKDGARDIREAYSHLREHSNSSFIVLLCIPFTSAIMLLLETNKISSSWTKDPDLALDSQFQILAFFCAWLVPNLFLWSRANKLEADFRDDPGKYLGEHT